MRLAERERELETERRELPLRREEPLWSLRRESRARERERRLLPLPRLPRALRLRRSSSSLVVALVSPVLGEISIAGFSCVSSFSRCFFFSHPDSRSFARIFASSSSVIGFVRPINAQQLLLSSPTQRAVVVQW